MWGLLKTQALLLWSAFRRWENDDGMLMSAAVAYYLGLSFFPFLMILIAVMGAFLRFTDTGQDAQEQILEAVRQNASPAVERQVSTMLEQIQGKSAWGGPLGVVGVVLAAVAGFLQFERAFDHIWNVEGPPRHGVLAGLKHALFERAVAFSVMLGLGLLVVMVFVAGLVLSGAQAWIKARGWHAPLPGPILRGAVTLSLNIGLFTAMYRFLPKQLVAWQDALRGAVLVALGWEAGSQLIAAFIIGDKYVSAYGVVGAFMTLLLWFFYATALILLGAEYIQTRHEQAGHG